MQSKRIESRLLLAIVLFGVLSTHLISAEGEEQTTAATNDQSTPQDSTAPAGVDSATSEAQVSAEATTGEGAEGSIPVAQATGTTVGESIAGGTGGQKAETTAGGSIAGDTGGQESGTTVGESIAGGTEGQKAETTVGGSIAGGAGGQESGTTVGESIAGGAGGQESGTTAGGSIAGGAGGAETVTGAGQSSPQETGGGETTTSAGESGITGTKQDRVGTVDEKTGTFPAESSTEGTEVKETASTTEQLDLGQKQDGEGSETEETTTGHINLCENWTVIVNTPATKFTCNITMFETDKNDKKDRSFKTYNITLVITDEEPRDRDKVHNITVEVTLKAPPKISDPYKWVTEKNKSLECDGNVMAQELKDSLTKIINGSSYKRFRRQADQVTFEIEKDTIVLTVHKNLTREELVRAFKHLLPEVTPTSDSKGESDPPPRPSPSQPGIWEAHFGLFLTVIILIAVCIVVTCVCCFCMRWRERGHEKHPDKQPIAMEEARPVATSMSNPIPDAEIIQDEGPMQERENPSVTPNGGGQHISKADEDNGWVVPLDELSKAEKEKPEVENTRL